MLKARLRLMRPSGPVGKVAGNYSQGCKVSALLTYSLSGRIFIKVLKLLFIKVFGRLQATICQVWGM
ncbi:MAG: hypothetical protein COW54_02965 [Rhodobacteraceae bacterium CG17_big_fil_post_rev_8_21_14_2_50_63_15]|nr:MAG: hypothetical protein COW54_02965 [Rhodobacteraceae bacterium CG17_big_fil_post_rev_8_21_14_2_50_63_15]